VLKCLIYYSKNRTTGFIKIIISTKLLIIVVIIATIMIYTETFRLYLFGKFRLFKGD